MKKTCGKCKINKPVEQFSKNNSKRDGLQGNCKECKKLVDSKYYKNNKQEQLSRNNKLRKAKFAYAAQRKNVPCMDCGQRFIAFAMDFDHVRGEKYKNISVMCNNQVSLKRLEEEIEKCDIVCANCHRIRTYNRLKGL